MEDLENSNESSFWDIHDIGVSPKGSVISEMLKDDFINNASNNNEIKFIWRLLWDKGIEFKSVNPLHDAELIHFIRNNITKMVNEETKMCSYVVYLGTDRQIVL